MAIIKRKWQLEEMGKSWKKVAETLKKNHEKDKNSNIVKYTI